MKTTIYWSLGGLASASLILAGCASTAPGGAGPSSNTVYSQDAGTAAEALEDGTTLMAYDSSMTSAARNMDNASGDSVWTDVDHPNVAITRNGTGAVDVTIDGRTMSFTAADLEEEGFGWEREDADGYGGVFTWTANSAAEALNGEGAGDYYQVWSYFWDNPDGETLNGYAVVGTEATSDAVAARSATATYSGRSVTDTYLAGTDNFDRTRIQGNVELEANFDDGAISGTLSDIVTRAQVDGTWSPNVNHAGTVAFDSAPIAANGYQGTLTPDAAFVDELMLSDFKGTYGGKFFGPNAEETAGAIAVTGTSDGDGFVGGGFFRANED